MCWNGFELWIESMISFYLSLFAIVLVVMIISFLVCVVSKMFDLTYNYICLIKSQL